MRATLHLDEPLLAQYARFLRGLATLDLGRLVPPPGDERDGARRRGARADGGARGGRRRARRGRSASPRRSRASGPWLPPRGRARGWSARSWASRRRRSSRSRPCSRGRSRRARASCRCPAIPTRAPRGSLFASALLAVPLAAHVGRIARAALAEVARAPFLAVASAKGASPLRVWVLHALPAVVGPIVTVVATQLGALLGGAVVLERMFERRGLGTLILEAYSTRDLPVLEGAVVAAGLLFVVAQALGTAVHVGDRPAREGAR